MTHKAFNPVAPPDTTAWALACHPATPSGLFIQISASLHAMSNQTGGGLLLRFELEGDVGRLLIPEPAAPGPADGLWQHTCFEAFVARADQTAYREFNFSPSGQWAAYHFSAERVRDHAAESRQVPALPDLTLERSTSRLTLEALVPGPALPEPQAGHALQIGLAAVIETTDGQLSYWALRHPVEKPDFHHRGGFLPVPDLPLAPSHPAPP